ncbi:MAG: tRNA (adenosine(37)-N6)-threonylcarbamoyltransferase complex dimerization subunit type 1 TsaB [Acidobacteriota bacterium]
MDTTADKPPFAPLVLAVDTSSASSSLAIARGGQDIATIAVANIRQHSQVIFDQLQMILALSETGIEEIDLFAAINGPGSFTGLRIGLAAVQGLARTLKKPVVGISAFDALAGDLDVARYVAALIDAGRGDVYLGLRMVDTQGMPRAVGADFVGSLGAVLEAVRNRIGDGGKGVSLLGSGAARYAAEILQFIEDEGVRTTGVESLDPPHGLWLMPPRQRFLAAWAARAAGNYLVSGDAGELMPYYLKPSDAEAKWNMLLGQ